MRLALFGKKVDRTNIESLMLFINKLSEYKHVELCYNANFYNMLMQFEKNIPQGTFFTDQNDLPKDITLFLSLGGDGTFLESLTLVQDRQIPIAGINFGRLGFLTTACVSEENAWIDSLLNGDYSVEDRTLITLEGAGAEENLYPYALNEITIQRSAPSMLEIDVAINGQKLPKYWADGIVIATATGSTAYSLSIGAPVVMPSSSVLIIAPIAPHNLNVRPLIVPDDSVIEISYTGRTPGAILTLDNRYIDVESGKKIKIMKGKFPLKTVSVNNNFIAALNQKLLWGEDKRNMQ